MKRFKMLKGNLGKIIVVTLFLLGLAGQALATTYYVSPSGSDSSSGSSSAPFKTIQKAADSVSSGDTVIVRNGVYTDTDNDNFIVKLDRGGTSSNWITFKAENKWGAKLDGENNSTGYAWALGDSTHSVQYVRIEDFDFYDMGRAIHANSAAHDVYIYRNKFHNINHVQDCNLNCGGYTCGGGPIFTDEATSHFTVDSNIFYDNGRLPQGGCSDLYYNHDHAWYANGNYNTAVNNIFYNNKAGWAIAMSNDASHFSIVNNTFYGSNPGREGFIFSDGNNSACVIENNIFYHNESGDEYAVRNSSTDSSSSFKNNLLYSASGSINTFTSSGNNSGSLSGTSGWTISGNITGTNPLFVDLSNYDFHLKTGSPAINKGIDIAGYDYDADGKAIVGAPDIGAYEYSGSAASPSTPSTDTTPPSTPTGLAATAASTSQINLSWAASTDNTGVSGYKVYRGTALIATTTTRSYSDTGLSPSTTYTYKVSAFDAAGNASAQSTSDSATTPSATTASDTQTPTVPANLRVTATSSSYIYLSWTASTDNVGVTGYKVYRNGTQIATVATTSYSSTGLAASTSYTYRVAAFDAAGNVSAQSSSISGTTTAASTTSSSFSVSGKVLRLDGVTPVSYVSVRLYGSTVKLTTTAADGSYQFNDVAPASCTVQAVKSGLTFQDKTVNVVNANVTGVNFIADR